MLRAILKIKRVSQADAHEQVTYKTIDFECAEIEEKLAGSFHNQHVSESVRIEGLEILED